MASTYGRGCGLRRASRAASGGTGPIVQLVHDGGRRVMAARSGPRVSRGRKNSRRRPARHMHHRRRLGALLGGGATSAPPRERLVVPGRLRVAPDLRLLAPARCAASSVSGSVTASRRGARGASGRVGAPARPESLARRTIGVAGRIYSPQCAPSAFGGHPGPIVISFHIRPTSSIPAGIPRSDRPCSATSRPASRGWNFSAW